MTSPHPGATETALSAPAEALSPPVAARPALFVGETRRLHPLSLLVTVLGLGRQSLNFLPALLAMGIAGLGRYIVPAIALYLVASLAVRWLSWSRFSWTVDADDVSIAEGVFSRRHRTIPFDRIQDVTIEQGLLARALGLAKVGFETGSAGAEKGNEASLDAISLEDAEALREHIRLHRSATAVRPRGSGAGGSDDAPGFADHAVTGHAAVPGTAPVPDRPLFALSPGRLVVAGLFDFSLAIFAVLFGLLQTFGDFLPFDPFSIDLWERLAEGFGLEAWVSAHRWMAAIGGLFSIIVLGLLTGVIRTALRDWGFTLDRSERGFRRRRGLTTRTDVAIPLARVQAALVRSGLVRATFGWYSLHLQSLAGDGENESDHVVAPFARLEEVDAILTEIGLDRAGLEDGEGLGAWHRSHAVSFILPALGVLLLIAAVVAGNLLARALFPDVDWPAVPSRLWVAVPVVGPLMVLGFGWTQWRRRRWSFDGRVLHIADGFLKRKHIILPARNVQSADIAIGPIGRRLGLADLVLGVPGASGYAIAAMPDHQARALRQTLLEAR